ARCSAQADLVGRVRDHIPGAVAESRALNRRGADEIGGGTDLHLSPPGARKIVPVGVGGVVVAHRLFWGDLDRVIPGGGGIVEAVFSGDRGALDAAHV